MRLLVATGNPGKLKEIRRLLASTDIEVVGLDAYPELPEVIEDGDSFTANALKKARTMAEATGLTCLADDSGLVVHALNGAPGIYSARYAGEPANDTANNAKLLHEMQGQQERSAEFVCVMALVERDGQETIFEGRLAGTILDHLQGEGGFGYDPLFLVPEYGCTLAEIDLDSKNRISHRGQALSQLIQYLITSS